MNSLSHKTDPYLSFDRYYLILIEYCVAGSSANGLMGKL